jgi:dCMP deaminase
MNKWDNRFLLMAKEVSKWSKDPSKKIGCVAINDNRQVLSTGYNGFPRGIDDTQERYDNREEKYKYVVHAEMNAIYNATWNGASLNGSTFYVYGLPVCSECAKGIIQSGVKKVVMFNEDVPERWLQSWAKTKALFNEAGVEYEFASLHET